MGGRPELDYDRHFALAAFAVDEPGEPGVGVARWIRQADDPAKAEAAVTVLSERGSPTPVAWTMLRAPRSSMSPVEPAALDAAVAASPLHPKYGLPVDARKRERDPPEVS